MDEVTHFPFKRILYSRIIDLDALKRINECLQHHPKEDGPVITGYELRHSMKAVIPDLIAAVELLADMRNLDVASTSLEFQSRREAILSRMGVES